MKDQPTGTGTVPIDPLFQLDRSSRCNRDVRARRAHGMAHSSPRQMLSHADAASQREGGRRSATDRFAPGEKHWHGAAPSTAMTHIAIQESLEGQAVEWLEHVSDGEYGRSL